MDINTTVEKAQKIPIHIAAEKGHQKPLNLILARMSILIKLKYQITPLYYAVDSGKFKTVKMLVQNGANINAKTKTVKILFDYSINQKRSRIGGYLDSKGGI